MKKNFVNVEHICGRVYSHSLREKTVQNQASANFGKSFLSGTIEIAVDEEGLNVIPVRFSYEIKDSKKVETYTTLKTILDTNRTWTAVGKDEALLVSVDTSLSVNDFISRDNQLVSAKANEGGFARIVNTIPTESTLVNGFRCDILIDRVARREADPERHIDEDYVIVHGNIFNFKKECMPVDLVVRNSEGMGYFENLDASVSNPVLTEVWGSINCLTKKRVVEEETAFGVAAVSTYETKSKEWLIEGCRKLPYEFGDENALTREELTKMQQDREVKLADVKRRKEERDMKPAISITTDDQFSF